MPQAAIDHRVLLRSVRAGSRALDKELSTHFASKEKARPGKPERAYEFAAWRCF
jgi:hypothetical protein